MKHALTVSFLCLICGRIVLFLLFGPRLVDRQKVFVVSRILTQPQVSASGQMFDVAISNAFGSRQVRVVTKRTEQFKVGEKVRISGSLSARVLQRNSTAYDLVTEDIGVLPSMEDALMQFDLYIRETITTVFQKVLSTNSAVLLIGIILGEKGNFTNGFLPALQTTGVVHIIAASGMNVTMVGGFLFALFSKYLRRQSAIVAVAICLGWYVVLSGMQPSILRAGVMMGFSLGAQFFGRQYDGLYALFLTAGLLMLFSPELFLDVGFQLSVASTVGILLIKPLFPRLFVVDDLTTTLAAQLATLPILLSVFGQYGLSSIVVNVLILWTIPFLMALGAVAAVFAFASPFFAAVALSVSAPLLWYIETVVRFFAVHVPSLSVGMLPVSFVVGYYLLLGAGVMALTARRKHASLPPLSPSRLEQ